jgi:xylulokinase
LSRNLMLAHDLGTSGNKATLFDPEGKMLASKTISYPSEYSNQNWAEQNPELWWQAVCDSTKSILEEHRAEDIKVVSFSGQMMGCLLVDKHGVPLRNHMMYSDQRAQRQTEQLIDRVGFERVFEITGHRASSSYSIAKLMWVRDNEQHIFADAYKMLHAKDYMNFLLTGNMVTEYNDASGTNALDLQKLQWSDVMIEAAQINESLLPPLVASSDVIGEVTDKAAQQTGLKAGTLVVAGAGDGGCATIGIGCVRPGITYNYIGSSSWISTTTTEVLPDPSMMNFTWAHPIKGYMQPCGTSQTAGASFDWFVNSLGKYETQLGLKQKLSGYDMLDELAASAPVGANGVVFLPYLMGERSPRWNPEAKGGFLGLSLATTKADMVRAVLEGVSMNLSVILRQMRKYVDIPEIRLFGGGAKGVNWRRIFADVYGVPVTVPSHLVEVTSMGAAVIGGVGSGILSSFDCVEDFLAFSDPINPIAEHTDFYDTKVSQFDEIYTMMVPMFGKLL